MFSVKHKIWAKVCDRKAFIESLLRAFSDMQHLYEIHVETLIHEIASNSADGDKDIESTIKSQYLNSFYDGQDNENLFNQAMLILVYSYYETCISLIAKERCINSPQKINVLIELICKAITTPMPEDIRKDCVFLWDKIRELRNFLVHNNTLPTSKRRIKILKSLTEKYPELQFEDNEITITGIGCLFKILEKEYNVLRWICKELGYITQTKI